MMDTLLYYLTMLTKISLSQYETNFQFLYSVEYTVPPNAGMYFASRISEAKNFSSITTGVTKDFYLNTLFVSKSDDQPLSIVPINTEMNDWNNKSFIDYQRDFFDVQLSGDTARFKNCSEYFLDCERLGYKEYNSSLRLDGNVTEDYFIINTNLQSPKKDPTVNASIRLQYSTEASVTLVHVKINTSMYYLIVTGISLHSVVLLFNVVNLIRKRKALRAVITKVKSQ
jgi:hypothetical protein